MIDAHGPVVLCICFSCPLHLRLGDLPTIHADRRFSLPAQHGQAVLFGLVPVAVGPCSTTEILRIARWRWILGHPMPCRGRAAVVLIERRLCRDSPAARSYPFLPRELLLLLPSPGFDGGSNDPGIPSRTSP